MKKYSMLKWVLAIGVVAASGACARYRSDNEILKAPSEAPPPSSTESPPVQEDPPSSQETPAAYPPLPLSDLSKENIGTKSRVANVFDRWNLKATVTGGRGTHYADVTQTCHGKIELEFALTADQWADRVKRADYYKRVHELIEKMGLKLLSDRGDVLQGLERENFMRALKALSWQESRWQHYLRYKDWFFIFLSGGSYNVLDDWGISQVARSGFSATELLNPSFFASGQHCSISKTLYYGFTEYYENYLESRAASCNQTGNPMDKLLGAYNKYSSGYSACYNGFSSDAAYRTYQVNAMKGLQTHYQGMPWLSVMGN